MSAIRKYPDSAPCQNPNCGIPVFRNRDAGSQNKYCSRNCAEESRRLGGWFSEEAKRKIGLSNSVALLGKTRPTEVKLKIAETVSQVQRGTNQKTGLPAIGSAHDVYGYKWLYGQYDHPLGLHTGGQIPEHRKILYDVIGPGPHPCHWDSKFQCGKLELEWIESRANRIWVDHLNEIRDDNRVENLVVSCLRCNWGRARRMK